jgi:Domain of unknown function (DUF4279)
VSETTGFGLSLRAAHPTRDTEELSRALGLKPGRSWRAGDPRQTPAGQVLGGTHKESYCYYDLATETGDEIQAAIRRANARLSPHMGVLRDWTRSGGRLTYYLSVWVRERAGDELPHDVILQMSELGVGLTLEYVPIHARRRSRGRPGISHR